MKGRIRYLALLVGAGLVFPKGGVAEQPLSIAAAKAEVSSSALEAARTPGRPEMPAESGLVTPVIWAPGEILRNVEVEPPGSPEIKKGSNVATGASVDEGAFLLPTWDPGFWVMPPGGLTRFLIPARGFINPDENPARGPAIVDSG